MPEQPAFQDWFQVAAPATRQAPAAGRPPASPEWLSAPSASSPADAVAADELEPVPHEHASVNGLAPQDTARSYSRPAAQVRPPSTAASTAPMPKFTPLAWSVHVTSDRTYYDQMQPLRTRMGWDLPFPAYTAERKFRLAGKQMRIGRRSAARGLEPEIDLSMPPADPGISRMHALLIPAPDGTWALLDPGSANGTLLNGREIASGDLIPLRDGDQINLGAWTAITVHRE